jgi:hypothetical protein
MVVVAYTPTDVFDVFVKDVFHLFMFGCLKTMPPTNKVVVLNDFNVEFDRNWESFIGALGQHHLHHGKVPSDNGECLLDLAASFGSVWLILSFHIGLST